VKGKKTHMKKTIILIIILATSSLLGCNFISEITTIDPALSTGDTTIVTDPTFTEDVDFDDADYDDYDEAEITTIDSESTAYMITEGGTYLLSGIITETIIIDVGDEDVRLVLDNVEITSTSNSAIMILSGDDITISAPEGTINYLTDSSTYSSEYTEYNATIYSECDLFINGTGTIIINANYNNAIVSKDDLMIVDVSLEIQSVDDGIIGRDSLSISNANIQITSNGDGLKATNDSNVEEGFIYIESGNIIIYTESDGIDAVNQIVIVDGEITIESSGKGIKSDTNIYIAGGRLNIDSIDDAINANITIEISGGEITIRTSDDGIKASEQIVISGGEITISASYEGIESPSIIINGGLISVVSSDDGINAASQTQTSFFPSADSSNTLTINGGTIVISSGGDSLDINGSIVMTGGEVYCYGPMSDNSAIDYDGTFLLSGGTICGLGSSQMAMAPSSSSSQASIMISLGSRLGAGITISIFDGDENLIFTAETTKTTENIVISLPELELGNNYVITIEGLENIEFSISNTITYLNENGETSSNPTTPRVPGIFPR